MGCCRPFLQAVLKSLNFILLLAGVLMLFYSWRLFQEWVDDDLAPAPSSSLSRDFHNGFLKSSVSEASGNDRLIQSGLDLSSENYRDSFEWPEIDWDFYLSLPWIIYATFGAGAFIVMVTIIGACAAETHVACCLSFYQIGLVLMLLVQAALASLIFFDSTWEKDLPDDPTGQAQKLKEFITANIDIFKWGALSVLIVELLALIMATALHYMARNSEFEDEDIYGHPQTREAARAPLLPETYVPTAPSEARNPSGPPELRSQKSDAWRTRMFEKYGLDTSELAQRSERPARNGDPSEPRSPETRQGGGCSIM